MLMKVQPPSRDDVAPTFAAHRVGRLDLVLDTPHRDHAVDLLSVHCTECEAQRFEPEQRLYARGVSGRYAYMIVEGIVRFERVTVAGNRRIIRVAGRGDLIGQEALLRQGYRDDAVACTPVILRRVSQTLIDDSEWRTGHLPVVLMSRWQDTLDESEFWSTEVATGPARRRVLQLLARLHLHRDEQQLIWMPRRDQMGDMLNITIETCSRVLSALRREGVLELIPPRQAQLDWGRLSEALQRSNH